VQVGAKVNGRLSSPAYKLRNADVVEVLTYDGPLSQRTIHMHRQWLRSAATRTAQHKIRMLLREWDRTHPPDPEEEALTEVRVRVYNSAGTNPDFLSRHSVRTWSGCECVVATVCESGVCESNDSVEG
jgi:(p)ppGpp synthase/HD superfamily hydrolase